MAIHRGGTKVARAFFIFRTTSGVQEDPAGEGGRRGGDLQLCVEEVKLKEGGRGGEEGVGVGVIAVDGMDGADISSDPWEDRQDGRRDGGRPGRFSGDYVFQRRGLRRRLEEIAHELQQGEEGGDPGIEGDDVGAVGKKGWRAGMESRRRAARRRAETRSSSMVRRGGVENLCSKGVGPSMATRELQKESVQVILFMGQFKGCWDLAVPEHFDHQPIATCSSIIGTSFLKKKVLALKAAVNWVS